MSSMLIRYNTVKLVNLTTLHTISYAIMLFIFLTHLFVTHLQTYAIVFYPISDKAKRLSIFFAIECKTSRCIAVVRIPVPSKPRQTMTNLRVCARTIICAGVRIKIHCQEVVIVVIVHHTDSTTRYTVQKLEIKMMCEQIGSKY
jgi:hypothetical protein